MAPGTPDSLPTYVDLVYPTLNAVYALGGSGLASEIRDRVVDDLAVPDDVVAITYDGRDKSIYLDRLDWARSYAKLTGILDSPKRGLFVISTLGKELLELPHDEALDRVRQLVRRVDRQVREDRGRTRKDRQVVVDADIDVDTPPHMDDLAPDRWEEALLRRLHQLNPEAFEEFVIYVLKAYGLRLTRVGGPGDEGIDGIGLAPLSPVLSSRVAVQAKRYDPSTAVGRGEVALFQRDASAAGAERAIFVTIARFSEPARMAATTATPNVDLIDGDRLCELVREQEIGIRIVPQVIDDWFDRFEQ